jgi:AhpD family alkylhydroperoxidase
MESRGRNLTMPRQMAKSHKLGEIARRRKWAHGTLLGLKSKVYTAFLEMERAAYSDGALPRKMKELIAVGISVVGDCESCMQWHIEQAARAGATTREVFESVEVGIEMGGGPATVSARFALEVIEHVFSGKSGKRARQTARRVSRSRKEETNANR